MSERSDVSDQLRLTENALRNVIASLLEEKLGTDWIEKTGVSPERLAIWRSKKETESKKLPTGNLETRILYFADFYDLKTIIQKHWDHFAIVFGEKKELEVLLSFLEDFRNPNAHARGLLPYQESLAIGICGEIRTKITQYRSQRETAQDCFPRIDSAYDNHGQTKPGEYFLPLPILRVGDRIEVVVEASDPEALPLEYQFALIPGGRTLSEQVWSSSNRYIIELNEQCIGNHVTIHFSIRSGRPYHAAGDRDDSAMFSYTVLPVRKRQ